MWPKGLVCPEGHGEQDGMFCSECGAKLVPRESPEVEAYSIFGDETCPGCGYPLEHGHQDFCPGCGHKLQWLCR